MFRWILTCVIGIVCLSCVRDKDEPVWSITIGEQIPSFSVETVSGDHVSDVSMRGHVAVITFFNTSCPDCRKELPVVDKLYKDYADDERIRFLCVARSENEMSVKDFWESNNLLIPVAAQENADVFHKFADSVIPRIYIFNSSGILLYAWDDNPLPSESELKKNIDNTLEIENK